mgnify:CR=1 FL=1
MLDPQNLINITGGLIVQATCTFWGLGVLGEMTDLDNIVFCHGHQSFDHIFQFPDITGPLII